MKNMYTLLFLILVAFFIMSAPVYIDTKRGDPTYTNNHKTTDEYIYTIADKDIAVDPNTILLMINGRFSDTFFAFHQNGEVYIPLKALGKMPDVYISWNKNKRSVNINTSNSKITLYADETTAFIDNIEFNLNFAPIIKDDYFYVTHTFIKSYFDLKTGYVAGPENNQLNIAENPVIYIDSYNADAKVGSLQKETLVSIKEKLNVSFESYKLLNMGKPLEDDIKALDRFIKENINDTKFVGMIGRYAVFKWSGIILYDSDTGSIYIYQRGKEMSSIVKFKKDRPDMFFYSYFYDVY